MIKEEKLETITAIVPAINNITEKAEPDTRAYWKILKDLWKHKIKEGEAEAVKIRFSDCNLKELNKNYKKLIKK